MFNVNITVKLWIAHAIFLNISLSQDQMIQEICGRLKKKKCIFASINIFLSSPVTEIQCYHYVDGSKDCVKELGWVYPNNNK